MVMKHSPFSQSNSTGTRQCGQSTQPSEFQLDSGQIEVYNLYDAYAKFREFLNSASLNGCSLGGSGHEFMVTL